MKRLLAAAIGFCIVGSLWAQSSFTIVRPADGSKVREKIRVLIPKDSIESGSYVGIFLNGKFVQAVVPPVEGNYRVYTIDTKAHTDAFPQGIPDGEQKLEIVKYVGGDVPRIADRSSVSLTVANHMNVGVPAGGVKLRYNFAPGTQMVYHVYEKQTLSTLSGLGENNGSHPAQFPTSQTDYRMLYAIDNTYPGGQSLIRMQLLPDKGKDYTVMQVEGMPAPVQIFDNQMQPVYMKISSTGRPELGSVPEYFGFASTGNGGAAFLVYNPRPLPVLPEKAVAPGSSWAAAYLHPIVHSGDDLAKLQQITEPIPMRGEFVDAEWEMGHPCAKIRNTIAVGTAANKALEKEGQAISGDKVSLDETIFFALDTHKIVKIVRTQTLERKVESQSTGTGMGGGPSGGPAGAPGRPGGMMGGKGGGGPMAPGGGPASAGGGAGNFFQGPIGAGGKGFGGQRGGPSLPGGMGNNPGMGSTGGGTAPQVQYIRIQRQETLILEQ